ncbi:unnamed protein product [Nippostrongylus brasiliensis]|uniref:DUF31 domain-containing protein n=1 Tax=Nippostrongylus brasiliensis TaxID=27835 RepID=A0A0N4YWZ2_NIPBR|nr:unnamed protein product [Nippostrongylus brasiliensis]
MRNPLTSTSINVPGDDSFFIGGIDFPIPTGDVGGVRLPFSGAFEYGTSPYAYAHGNAFNPVSPFDMKSIDDEQSTPLASVRRSPAMRIDKKAFYEKFYDKLPQ